jgi:hypothetical protein
MLWFFQNFFENDDSSHNFQISILGRATIQALILNYSVRIFGGGEDLQSVYSGNRAKVSSLPS